MAFMGILMMWLTIILVVLGVCIFNGILFLVISLIMKSKAKKNPITKEDGTTKIKKGYRIPGVISFLFFLPVILFVGYVAFEMISQSYHDNKRLAYHVMNADFDKVNKMIDDGVSPDCTFEANDIAKDNEYSLLAEMCAGNGFIDFDGRPTDEELTDDETKMVKLLISKGADLEKRHFYEPESEPSHSYQREQDQYMVSDECGSTPLLIAAKAGNFEMVKLLIEEGADVTARDFCGFGLVETIVDNYEDDQGYDILVYAVEHGAPTDGLTNYRQSALFLAQRHGEDFKNDKIKKYLANCK